MPQTTALGNPLDVLKREDVVYNDAAMPVGVLCDYSSPMHNWHVTSAASLPPATTLTYPCLPTNGVKYPVTTLPTESISAAQACNPNIPHHSAVGPDRQMHGYDANGNMGGIWLNVPLNELGPGQTIQLYGFGNLPTVIQTSADPVTPPSGGNGNTDGLVLTSTQQQNMYAWIQAIAQRMAVPGA